MIAISSKIKMHQAVHRFYFLPQNTRAGIFVKILLREKLRTKTTSNEHEITDDKKSETIQREDVLDKVSTRWTTCYCGHISQNKGDY